MWVGFLPGFLRLPCPGRQRFASPSPSLRARPSQWAGKGHCRILRLRRTRSNRSTMNDSQWPITGAFTRPRAGGSSSQARGGCTMRLLPAASGARKRSQKFCVFPYSSAGCQHQLCNAPGRASDQYELPPGCQDLIQTEQVSSTKPSKHGWQSRGTDKTAFRHLHAIGRWDHTACCNNRW